MKLRAATYSGLAAVVLVILLIFHLTDILPSRFGGRWQPDGEDGRGYIMELTADSLLTTAGPGEPLRVFTADTLESRMMAISVGASRLRSSSRLFDAAWDYAWYRLMTSSPDMATVFLTLPALPSGAEGAEEVMRLSASEAFSRKAWPLANVRSLMWISAAAELALTAGDKSFADFVLAKAEGPMTNDSLRLYDLSTGLWRGGGDGAYSGALPSWFNRADRYNLMSLTVNVAAADTYMKLAELCRLTGDNKLAGRMRADGEQLAAAVRHRLWLPVDGRFSQYLYGRVAKVTSPASTGLGNALAASSPAVTDIVMARRIVDRLPRTPYGILTTYPASKGEAQIEDTPLAQSIWAAGCRRADDPKALWHSLASLLRLVCLTASDEEEGQEACAAFIGAVVRSIIGMKAETDGLSLSPFIPLELGTEIRITGMNYRDAVLDIIVVGNGTEIASMTIDGASQPDHRIPVTIRGRHKVRVEMTAPSHAAEDDDAVSPEPIRVPDVMPDELIIDSMASDFVSFANPTEAAALIFNGRRMENFAPEDFGLPQSRGYRETLFFTVNEAGRISGLSSEPRASFSPGSSTLVQAEWFKARELAREAYRRMQRAWLNKKGRGKGADIPKPNRRLTQIVALPDNEMLSFVVESDNAADCVIEVGYTQGLDSGPRDMPLRAVSVNGFHHTVLAMPRTIAGGDTTLTVTTIPTIVKLHEGTNEITLYTRQSERHPSSRPDTVMIDYLRITPL